MMHTQSSLQVYLNEISHAPLLTAARECELARRLIRENDPAARNELVVSNLRFVVSIAKNYANRGIDLQDLIAEGNIGLLRAVERFNPDLNIRFVTYAGWWINQRIRRALHRIAAPVYIPTYMIEMIGNWKRTVAEMKEELGRLPTVFELSNRMSISLKLLRLIQNAAQTSQPRLMSGSDNDDAPTLNTFIEDENASTPDTIAIDRDDIQCVRKLLGQIDPRGARILRLNFGLEDGQPRTLQQIASKLGLTRERIRQIKQQALGDLYRLLGVHHSQVNRWHDSDNVGEPMETVSALSA